MSKRSLRPWKTISKQTILKRDKFLTVENHIVELPDGRTITDWSWIVTPDAAIILAQTREDKFLCFRQTKYALDGITLAPPAGMLEVGEVPMDAAKRELREETGYEASDWVHLGSFRSCPNKGVATMHLFLARDARRITQPDSDDLEDQELLLLDRHELESALFQGEFKALMWTATVALALQYIDHHATS